MTRRTLDPSQRIAAFRATCSNETNPPMLLETIVQALSDSHRLLVAAAAEVCAERFVYDAEPALIRAFRRFKTNPNKKDPGCVAKGAILRALVALETQDTAFFRAALGYRQPEPVWGGKTDTAVALRADAAMGLVNTGDPRALINLVELLADAEYQGRIGAIRAIAYADPLAAEALLRAKALAGDAEPQVIGQCMSALLRLEAEDLAKFVGRFLDHQDPEVAELAALALGESGRDNTLPLLVSRWNSEPLKGDRERGLLRAAALHRSDAAFDWLLEIIKTGDGASARFTLRELEAYASDAALRERILAALTERDDPELWKSFDHPQTRPEA